MSGCGCKDGKHDVLCPIAVQARFGKGLTDVITDRVTMPSRTHEVDEPGHIIDGDPWPYINLGPIK